jgi:hypothetical protein
MIFALSLNMFAQSDAGAFRVKYVTGENVYLDGGSAKGLNVGDKLYVVRNQKDVIAQLELIYVAEYSASCKILNASQTIQVGDIAAVVETKKPESSEPQKDIETGETSDVEKAVVAAAEPLEDAQPRTSLTRISGSVSVQFFHLDDRTKNNLDFTRPAFRLNFRAQRLWGREFNLRVRTRSLYNIRTRPYSSRVPQEEWRNRVYELSFSYEDRRSPLNYKFGRIISNYMSGVGYIDGGQVQYNFSPSVRIGVFGGTQPDLQNSKFQTAVKKYGAYFNLAIGSYQNQYFETTIAGAAQYHSSTVSREFLYFQNNYSYNSRLTIYQSMEVDINRQWRKEKAGQSTTLSNFFISGRYRFSRAVTAGLTYDNRRNYWTYEVLSVADSLFDDALRTGLRGNLSLRLPGSIYVFANGGYRKKETDEKATVSYAGGVNKSNLLVRGFFINLNYAGFTGPFTDGQNGSVTIGQDFLNGVRIAVDYGIYGYTITAIDETRNSRWARLNMNMYLFRHLFFAGQYEYDWGDDLQGQRFLVELGYRF